MRANNKSMRVSTLHKVSQIPSNVQTKLLTHDRVHLKRVVGFHPEGSVRLGSRTERRGNFRFTVTIAHLYGRVRRK